MASGKMYDQEPRTFVALTQHTCVGGSDDTKYRCIFVSYGGGADVRNSIFTDVLSSEA
jgi:hypothetical protein